MSDNSVILEPVYYNIEIIKQDNEVSLASPGPQGPKGDTGPQGPQGIAGQDGTTVLDLAKVSFTYEQQSSSTIWTITHNLGYRPAVFITDYTKNTLEGDISHTNNNALVITFTDSVVGYAYLS
jgi:hypothetical protein